MSRLSELKKMIIEYSQDEENFYDLFCDHGKLGLSIQDENLFKKIIFNDCQDHLISMIKEKNKKKAEALYLICKAQDIKFKQKSLVVGAGVGGLLLIDCLSQWIGQHDSKTLSQLVFILSPHYYDFELRLFLKQGPFEFLGDHLCRDQKYFYDMIVVRWSRKPLRRTPLVSQDSSASFYSQFIEHRHKTLSKIRDKSAEITDLLRQYEEILTYE